MPKLFLCHSTADQVLATRVATDLRAHGVDVWYAPWELQTGDSLRRKIEAGIASCTHFGVLLTPSSIESEWAQTELDAGVVKRIEEGAGFVVMVDGLAHERVPLLLRGRLYTRLDSDYGNELMRLARTLHGLPIEKPPLGAPPPTPRLQLPLTPEALLIADALLAAWPDCSTRHGLADDELRSALPSMPWPRVVEALDELDAEGLIGVDHGWNDFAAVVPRPALFLAAALSRNGDDLYRDGRAVAAEVAGADTWLSAHEVATRLGWDPARVNTSLHWLMAEGALVEPMKLTDGRPEFAYSVLSITPQGRRLARGAN